jgi:hypothetical protein
VLISRSRLAKTSSWMPIEPSFTFATEKAPPSVDTTRPVSA